MLDEFKKFMLRGNVIDLAVAVMIGAAFGAIVTSLTKDIITPLLGILLGGLNFSGLSLTVGKAAVAYGNFVQAVINFLITGIALFVIVKAANRLAKRKKPEPAPPAAPPKPSPEVVLLTEIRDLLRKEP